MSHTHLTGISDNNCVYCGINIVTGKFLFVCPYKQYKERGSMECLTCNGKGSIQNDMYHPAVTCIHCKGSGIENNEDKEEKEDNVNSPKHYTFGTIEVIDVIEDWGLNNDFCLGNTIKYIARARHKGRELEDLKKAQWYLNRKIKNMELEIAAKDDK